MQLVEGRWQPADGPLFTELALAPGQPLTRQVRLISATKLPVRVTVSTHELSQAENGCTENEREAGDNTCDPHQGELPGHLQVMVRSNGALQYRGSLSGLEDVKVANFGPSGRTAGVAVTLWLPEASANVVQSDSLEFGLRWMLTSRHGHVVGSRSH
ncbi:hypothetical protein [Nocardioides coralli]|uniref:hypothetical protein n=1 Tax=Nocardioides coralli TaxID=2872154 RepID=UPI001CA4052B|nr:hypothetical protein [Nocardioides coralli]QZY28763.1 hypothetical protein K6T13_15090 [Nocardioides coralli]